MRRPNVYERSAPRGVRRAYREPATDGVESARAVAYGLAPLIARATTAGQSKLIELLEAARDEAERVAGEKIAVRPEVPPGE